MAERYKIQAYDVSETTKRHIEILCEKEKRSESFIISRLLNRLFDPIEKAQQTIEEKHANGK